MHIVDAIEEFMYYIIFIPGCVKLRSSRVTDQYNLIALLMFFFLCYEVLYNNNKRLAVDSL